MECNSHKNNLNNLPGAADLSFLLRAFCAPVVQDETTLPIVNKFFRRSFSQKENEDDLRMRDEERWSN